MESELGLNSAVTMYGNTIQLFYYDASNGNLRHAWKNGTNWSFETLDGAPGTLGNLNANVGNDPSVTTYRNGTELHVFYYDGTNGNLRQAWHDAATVWHFATLEGDLGAIGPYDADVGRMSTVTVVNGNLQIFHYEASGGNLRHAHHDVTGWHFENLDGAGGLPSSRRNADPGFDPVALGYGTNVQLFYYDGTNGNYRHSWSQ